MNMIEYCDSNEVVIEIYYNDSFIQILKKSLFTYVKEHQLNYWVDDFYDPKESDGHGQATGYYNFEQYFELPFEQIENDIIKYLNQK
jgi:hypothetical protein